MDSKRSFVQNKANEDIKFTEDDIIKELFSESSEDKQITAPQSQGQNTKIKANQVSVINIINGKFKVQETNTFMQDRNHRNKKK